MDCFLSLLNLAALRTSAASIDCNITVFVPVIVCSVFFDLLITILITILIIILIVILVVVLVVVVACSGGTLSLLLLGPLFLLCSCVPGRLTTRLAFCSWLLLLHPLLVLFGGKRLV